MKNIFQKHLLKHGNFNSPSDMGSDCESLASTPCCPLTYPLVVRHVYHGIGQSLYKNCSSGYNFSEHQGSMNMESVIEEVFAPYFLFLADDLVPLDTCVQ
jgi:hypothetical protein